MAKFTNLTTLKFKNLRGIFIIKCGGGGRRKRHRLEEGIATNTVNKELVFGYIKNTYKSTGKPNRKLNKGYKQALEKRKQPKANKYI